MTKKLTLSTLAVACAVGAACTVHQSEPPPLAGPSELAQSVTVTATPDIVKLGVSATSFGESATVAVQVRGPDGAPLANKAVRLDLAVGNFYQECGYLSLRDVVTGSDGRAVARFTAPGVPMPMPDCAGFNGEITIVANVVGTNRQTALLHTASIRLVPPSVIVPPGSAVVNFSISPNPAKALQDVTFADAGSAVAPGRTISRFTWDFSDGAREFGPLITHDFLTEGTYTVTLTVTDDIGQASFKSAPVTITP